jgi:hypothetical protein
MSMSVRPRTRSLRIALCAHFKNSAEPSNVPRRKLPTGAQLAELGTQANRHSEGPKVGFPQMGSQSCVGKAFAHKDACTAGRPLAARSPPGSRSPGRRFR